jgi:hypothetical protein
MRFHLNLTAVDDKQGWRPAINHTESLSTRVCLERIGHIGAACFTRQLLLKK